MDVAEIRAVNSYSGFGAPGLAVGRPERRCPDNGTRSAAGGLRCRAAGCTGEPAPETVYVPAAVCDSTRLATRSLQLEREGYMNNVYSVDRV